MKNSQNNITLHQYITPKVGGSGWGAAGGRTKMHEIQDILANKASEVDINAQDDKGDTALIKAASSGVSRQELVNLLLKHGADVDIENNEGKTALLIASENGSDNNIISAILEKAPKNLDSNHPLVKIYKLEPELEQAKAQLKQLQEKQEKFKKLLGNDSVDNDELSDLNKLKESVDVNQQDKQATQNNITLHQYITSSVGGSGWGAAGGRTKMDEIQDILKNKASEVDINAQDDKGDTALIKAVSSGISRQELVNLLLVHKADVNIENKEGKTALLIASENGSDDNIISAILEKAPKNLDSNHPLVKAYKLEPELEQTKDQLKKLQEKQKGFKKALQDKFLDCVKSGDLSELEKIIGEVDVNQQDEKKFFPIYHAVAAKGIEKQTQTNMVQLLIDNGAKVENIVVSDGIPLLQVAVNQVNFSVVDILIKNGAYDECCYDLNLGGASDEINEGDM